MRVDQFDFTLPKASIAQSPVYPKDQAKLLHVNGDTLDHCQIKELPDLLNEGDLLVCNNTKVIPARLFVTQEGRGPIELMLHKREGNSRWYAFSKPARKLKVGIDAYLDNDVSLSIISKEGGEVLVDFHVIDDDMFALLDTYGQLPLPPYIERDSGVLETDDSDYQTIFSHQKGAVAAPTAGLHFTEELLGKLADKRVELASVTLHVGAGTFLPVKVDDTKDHVMHHEYGHIDAKTADHINRVKARGNKVVAIGTTSLRVLESATDEAGYVRPFDGMTDIFITPGYVFKVVDRLLTNFHLPQSTLFMLVSAFSGLDHMKHAYTVAIDSGYRFYSYGDACLLELDQ